MQIHYLIMLSTLKVGRRPFSKCFPAVTVVLTSYPLLGNYIHIFCKSTFISILKTLSSAAPAHVSVLLSLFRLIHTGSHWISSAEYSTYTSNLTSQTADFILTLKGGIFPVLPISLNGTIIHQDGWKNLDFKPFPLFPCSCPVYLCAGVNARTKKEFMSLLGEIYHQYPTNI